MAHSEPLQDATEVLRNTWQSLPGDLSRFLHTEAPHLTAAIQAVVEAAGVSHIDPPVLTADERSPEDDTTLYDTVFDTDAPRHLKDVWDGVGDPGDPLVPQDNHEHELVLARLREAADKEMDRALPTE